MSIVSASAQPVRVRTLFLSDVHLGMKGCQAERLMDFLLRHETDTIFLVGDIFDGWRLKPGRSWQRPHLRVVFELLARARKGCRVVYIPGNHDEFVREFVGMSAGGIEIARRAIHEGADGQRYLITHGDHVDLLVRRAPWLAFIGHAAYRALLVLNTYLNIARRRLGMSYWSLSAWAKAKVKKAMIYISDFEANLAAEARQYDADGVICGHIHHAADHRLFGVRYINAGDWVESCTAVVEHQDGRFEIVRWIGARREEWAPPAFAADARAAIRAASAVATPEKLEDTA